MINTDEAVAAIREIFATYSPSSGEPCDGCFAAMIRTVLRQHVDSDLLAHYTAALDEIYALRAALATEARVTEVHLLLKTFPKSRRAVAEEQVARMRLAATLRARTAYNGTPDRYKELRRIGGDTLTRAQWEARES